MKKKVRLCLTAEEYRIVLQSLVNLKNELIRQGRYTDCVDDLILIDAPVKKIKIA